MSTYTQILYQIVFGTFNHEHTLIKEDRDELYRYITGVLRKKQCHLYQVGGITDHVHIITHIHPSIALASLIKDIKLSTSVHFKEKGMFPQFNGWQEGYGAFTYDIKSKQNLINYVANQEEHHRKKTFREELIELLKEHGVDYNEKYLL